jgi:hypothetical protein
MGGSWLLRPVVGGVGFLGGLGVGEGGVVDLLADIGLVGVFEQVQVVDAGGLDRAGFLGLDRGAGRGG